MSVSNQTTPFIKYIFETFDKKNKKKLENLKLEEQALSYSCEGAKAFGQHLKNLSNESPIDELITACFIEYHACNSIEWAYDTNILNDSNKKPFDLTVLNATASTYLSQVLGVPQKDFENIDPARFLWRYIFNDVYVNEKDVETRLKILTKICNIQPDSITVPKIEVIAYRVTKAVGSFFNHPKVRYAIVLLFAAISYISVNIFKYKIENYAKRFFCDYLFKNVSQATIIKCLIVAFSYLFLEIIAVVSLMLDLDKKYPMVKTSTEWIMAPVKGLSIIQKKLSKIPDYITQKVVNFVDTKQQEISQSSTAYSERVMTGICSEKCTKDCLQVWESLFPII